MKKIKTVTQSIFLAVIAVASVLTSSVAKTPAQTEVQKEKTENKEICCNYDVTKNINYKWGTSGLDRITFTRSDISNTKEFYASCLDAYYMNAGKMQQVAPQSYQVITEDLGKI